MVDFGGGKNLSSSQQGDDAAVPFEAIVGQGDLKTGLLAIATHPDLDGLLIEGEKGTAKSTAVRGLAAELPEQDAIADCPYGCHPSYPNRQCRDCRDRADPPVESRPVPLVTLPLGATRERVVGSVSVADALEGEPSFEPGLLAAANRGILYVDEVNLLPDHLVDVLLDVAASGVNRVQRDGIDTRHPADFTLVGTMNPEEGDLRPQLRDRFDLRVAVEGLESTGDRVAVIDQALSGGAVSAHNEGKTGQNAPAPDDQTTDGPSGTVGMPSHEGDSAEGATTDLGATIRAARNTVEQVTLPHESKVEIATLCHNAGVDGHRADIATARAAITIAALDGRERVTREDIKQAAEFALPHRLQSDPFEDPPDPSAVIEDHFTDDVESGDQNTTGDQGEHASKDGSSSEQSDGSARDGGKQSSTPKSGDETASGTDPSQNGADATELHKSDSGAGKSAEGGTRGEKTASPTEEAAQEGNEPTGDERTDGDVNSPNHASRNPGKSGENVRPLVPGATPPAGAEGTAPAVDMPDETPGGVDAGTTDNAGRARTYSHGGDGPRVRSKPATTGDSVDVPASVRAAATRGGETVTERDLRQSVREQDTGAVVVIAIDASASMRPAMQRAKGVALDLLRDAYEERDAVSVVTFGGEEAAVVLPPTDSVAMAARHLKELPTADRTPLPAGLTETARVIDRADAHASVAVVVTDGRANVAEGSPTDATKQAATQLGEIAHSVLIVDAGEDGRGLIGDISAASGGRVLDLSELTPDRVHDALGD